MLLDAHARTLRMSIFRGVGSDAYQSGLRSVFMAPLVFPGG